MKEKSKLVGIILIIAILGVFSACDDDPKPKCKCATPHYLTCGDYNCEASHSHTQAAFHTLGGINVYITAGVTADDALKIKLNNAWNNATTTNLTGKITRINVTNTGDGASCNGAIITINGTLTAGEIMGKLNDINSVASNAQSNDNVKMANGLQKLNRCT